MINYKSVIRSQKVRLMIASALRLIPIEPYLRLVFYIKTGRKISLNSPKTFCDKQNWLKIHEKNPLYTLLADKYAVRDYIKKRIGESYSFPLIGKWDKVEEIDFNKLPNEFVLKCNHDSGSVKVVRNKSRLSSADISTIKSSFKFHLRRNPYYDGREYPYKDIKPSILAEKLMLDSNGEFPKDYKFFCFNGKPFILFVATDREHDVKFDFYDMQWNHLNIVNIHPQSGKKIEKPKCFDEMKTIAEKLSEGMKFVRIDLYEIDGRVYFGEYTFFHGGGFWPMAPNEWEIKLGDLIAL